MAYRPASALGASQFDLIDAAAEMAQVKKGVFRANVIRDYAAEATADDYADVAIPSDDRVRLITPMMDDDDKALLETAAARCGTSVRKFVRTALIIKARRMGAVAPPIGAQAYAARILARTGSAVDPQVKVIRNLKRTVGAGQPNPGLAAACLAPPKPKRGGPARDANGRFIKRAS